MQRRADRPERAGPDAEALSRTIADGCGERRRALTARRLSALILVDQHWTESLLLPTKLDDGPRLATARTYAVPMP